MAYFFIAENDFKLLQGPRQMSKLILDYCMDCNVTDQLMPVTSLMTWHYLAGPIPRRAGEVWRLWSTAFPYNGSWNWDYGPIILVGSGKAIQFHVMLTVPCIAILDQQYQNDLAQS